MKGKTESEGGDVVVGEEGEDLQEGGGERLGGGGEQGGGEQRRYEAEKRQAWQGGVDCGETAGKAGERVLRSWNVIWELHVRQMRVVVKRVMM